MYRGVQTVRMTASFLFLIALGGRAAEVLYNGIELPSEWPPRVCWEDIKSRKPLPEPPYLKQPPAAIPIDVGRQLFVDDFLVEETTLKTTCHRAEYHPANPVFTEGMPFSGGVFWDPRDQLIKMWYYARGSTGFTTSRDGIHWDQGRLVLPGATDSQCVWLDLEEPDPAKRFKMTRSVVADNRCRGWIYLSADGIAWRQAGYTGDWGDRSTFFWNPFRKLWVMSCRHGWGQPRARRYWEVKDFEKGPYWRQEGQPTDAPFWIGADVLDPPRPDYKIEPQLYNLDAVGYESLMLGLFTIWRGQPGPREKPNEVCVGFSRDGFHWSRPDRRPFCPVSETPGTWNYANVQSAAGGCLVMGDRLFFYVSARGAGQVAGLATLRRDGFASVDADETGGSLTTRLLTFKGRYAFVNLDAPQGELRTEILDEQHRTIAPFTKENCAPIRADSTLAALRWKGADDLGAIAGRKVRFRFHLKNGQLYAFWFSPDRSGASHGYVAAGGPGFTSNQDTVGGSKADAAEPVPSAAPTKPPSSKLAFINTGFEGASPLQWQVDSNGTVQVFLLYDYERNSPNRAAGHWHFQLQGEPGSDLTLVLHNFDNIYNGKPGAAVSQKSICYASPDGKQWKALPAEFLEGNRLRICVRLEGPSLYLARLEPYRLSDLQRLLDGIRGHPLVEITEIGRTVEGRPLELVRVGKPGAPYRVFLRARAHAWEPGGNWVVQGMIRGLLSDDEAARRCLQRYCLYVLPMANKDGVVRGRTRFNSLGKDLNRDWDRPADERLAPENHALEAWIKQMTDRGRRLDFAMDLHNDESGGFHISRPPIQGLEAHVEKMKLFEQLLRKHTWFTEGSSGSAFRTPGSLGEGLLERYGIDACILEFNCNWIAGLKQYPSGEAWEQFGRGLTEVFYEYFGSAKAGDSEPPRPH